MLSAFHNARSIRTKLLIATGTATMLVVVTLATALGNMKSIQSSFERFLDVDQPELEAYNQMYAQGLQGGQAIRNIVLDPANQKAYANLDSASAKFDEALATAMTLAKEKTETLKALEGIAETARKVKETRETIRGLAESKPAAAAELLNKAETPAWRTVRDALLKLIEARTKSVADIKAGIKEQASLAMAISLGLGAFAIVLGGLFVLWVVSNVKQALSALQVSMDELARGEGDLTKRLAVSGKDEIAQTSLAFNRFMEGLHGIIRNVGGTSEELSGAATELSAAAMHVSESSTRQSEAASATAAAVEEVTVAIASVAESAEQVRELSNKSLENAHNGNRSVAELVDEMDHVSSAVKEIAASVAEFVSSTNVITSMTKQVKAIAEQTNLLALNAAIEAARAGDQGRGFAVVADEVRKLAEKSGESASQIDAVTQAIELQSAAVEKSIERGFRSLEASATFLNSVSSVLSDSTRAVTHSNHGVDDIANSVREQRTASTEIAQHVEKIARMAEDNSHAVQETSAAAHRLEQLAAHLQSTVGRFRV